MSTQLQLDPEGTGGKKSSDAPPSTGRDSTMPGRDFLTLPASREVTDARAERWQRRRIAVEVVKQGRGWTLVEAV